MKALFINTLFFVAHATILSFVFKFGSEGFEIPSWEFAFVFVAILIFHLFFDLRDAAVRRVVQK